ncbi:hypothetical protein XI03_34805 [Bradyrhizobium sp. CCBAU 65884]|nr:hypothetical protein [Bradyrhizobium sp. CCBAU 65884]
MRVAKIQASAVGEARHRVEMNMEVSFIFVTQSTSQRWAVLLLQEVERLLFPETIDVRVGGESSHVALRNWIRCDPCNKPNAALSQPTSTPVLAHAQ